MSHDQVVEERGVLLPDLVLLIDHSFLYSIIKRSCKSHVIATQSYVIMTVHDRSEWGILGVVTLKLPYPAKFLSCYITITTKVTLLIG